MATKKKGLCTTSGEWAVHLRPHFKRKFWKRERKACKRAARLISMATWTTGLQ